MKKRTGLALAGGILEIIAGINLLIYALWALYIFSKIPNGLSLYNWDMLIIFCCLIFFGIMAIIGKPKKDLTTYGIINLLNIAYMIYTAVGNSKNIDAILTIILVFSFEISLLIISSMFFFFTKKSEYDIVFEDRLKTRKENQPQEYKKLKKTYILISLSLVLTICLSQLLDMVGVIVLILSAVGFIVLTAIVSKKNKSDYSLKTNIVFCCIAIFIMFGCVTYNNISYQYQQTTLTSSLSPIMISVQDTYLWYDTSENDYLVLKGIYGGNETGCLIYVSDNRQFDELPENAMEIVAECRYVNPTTNKNEIAYRFFEYTTGSLKYYCEANGEILNDLPEYKIIAGTKINKMAVLVIDLVGLLVAVILILGTYNVQLEFNVKKQLKTEEKGQVINKYNNNISQSFQTQPQQNIQSDTNMVQTPQTRVLPPLPKEKNKTEIIIKPKAHNYKQKSPLYYYDGGFLC